MLRGHPSPWSAGAQLCCSSRVMSSLVASQAGWVLLTSLTVSSPTPLYPSSLGKVGWPLEGLLKTWLILHLGNVGFSISPLSGFRMLTWSQQPLLKVRLGQIFLSEGEGCSCLLFETYLYILLMCVFPFL